MATSAWTKPGRFNRQSNKQPRLNELLPIRKLKSGVFYRERFIGPAYTFAEHWIEIYKKDGTTKVRLRKLCLSYDHESGEFKGGCPYCDVLKNTPRTVALQCSINRKEQKREPLNKQKPLPSEKKLVTLSDGEQYYLKQKDSETWTPVDVLQLSSSVGQRVGDMAALNTKRDKKTGEEISYGPEHADFGFDLTLKYDENASPANAYFVQKEDKTQLSDDELDYRIFKLDVEVPETEAEAQREAENLLTKLVDTEGLDTAGANSGSGAKGSSRSAKGYLGDLDEEDDSDGFDPGEEEADDEPPPRRGNSRRAEPEDDDPPPRRRAAPTSRSRDDDYEDEPAPRRSSRRAEPEDDYDDEPAPRRASASRSRDDYDDDPPPRRTAPTSRRRNDGLDL